MKKLAIILGMGIVVTMINCSPKKASQPSAAPQMTKAIAQEQYTIAQLASGQALYAAHCGTCHKLYKVETFNDAKWNQILNRMIPKTDVSTTDGTLIRAYVLANAAQN
ncbi:hypothetical protein DBR32_08730 [Taibaiella sp. KBW10]|uniref:cytochrome c n=1 Tax=Taibaiella sp. KBW10 TaxID=2153357 RepID=UPI000F58F486|nr:cytochrome c [Taibaiella sp. KBW10]RQO30798.1 hypothetical protein DBR32_08730 [Taibaiella sp. KBW10]